MTTIDTPQTANFAMTGQSVPLDQLPLGSRCQIEAIDEDSESLLRLMEMGLVPGAIATIEHSAPFKSPYSLRLQGCTLAVRREDARRVRVTLLPPSPSSETPTQS